MRRYFGAVLFAMLVLAIGIVAGANPTETVEGHVRYKDTGTKVGGALVTVTIDTDVDGDPDPDVYTTTTDSYGFYSVEVQYLNETDTAGGDPITVEAKKGTRQGSTSLYTINRSLMHIEVAIDGDGSNTIELTPTMETEDFGPLVFLHRDGCKVLHNYANGNCELIERIENYAFEGEQIACEALVVDKNGFPEKLRDVYITVSEDQEPTPYDIEVNCDLTSRHYTDVGQEFNARISEELLTWNSDIMGVYNCILTVESQDSMHGEYWISVVAEDLDDQVGYAVEQQYWFLNPDIALIVSGGVDFGTVRPGTLSYASTITVENDAEYGSGVLLDMHISGRDFTDPTNSGAKCPTSNVLALSNFGYYARSGAYHTTPGCAGRSVYWSGVDEGYYNIPYENGNEASRAPIIECDGFISLNGVQYWAGNVLSPGAEISLTFALALPEPCNGDFTDGSFYLWAEAV